MHLILQGIDHKNSFYNACQCKHQRVKFDTTVKWFCFCNGFALFFSVNAFAFHCYVKVISVESLMNFPSNQIEIGIDTCTWLVHIVGKGNALIMYWGDIVLSICQGGNDQCSHPRIAQLNQHINIAWHLIDFVQFTMCGRVRHSGFIFRKGDISKNVLAHRNQQWFSYWLWLNVFPFKLTKKHNKTARSDLQWKTHLNEG